MHYTVHYTSLYVQTSAFSEDGQLQMDKHSSLNKIGHALHYINPVFRKISFSQKVQLISRSLSLRDPAIVQGMYIFKNPGIGRGSLHSVEF